MIRLGAKYAMEDFVTNATRHLSRAFPTDIQTWDSIRKGTRRCLRLNPRDYISVATLARIHNLPSHIRWQALYHCCQLPITSLVDNVLSSELSSNGPQESLSVEDLKRCLVAREKLIDKELRRLLESICIYPSPCSRPLTTRFSNRDTCYEGQQIVRSEAVEDITTINRFEGNPLNGCNQAWEDYCKNAGLCIDCTDKRIKSSDAFRQRLLLELESCFSLD